jgi:putative membrane protein
MPLSIAERNQLDNAVTQVEAATGAQVVVACVPRSDSYAELPWLAFAFATAFAALAVVARDMLSPGWATSTTILFAIVGILASATAAALATVFIPPLARWFLRESRAEVEVRQQAQSLFLQHELFATRERCGVLVLVSEFERRIVILPDTGVSAQVPHAAFEAVIEAMRDPLARGQLAQAFEIGLAMLQAALVQHGMRFDPGNSTQLPNSL